MSEFHWAVRTPEGFYPQTFWRRTDAIEALFQSWGGAEYQGPRKNWWRRMKMRGYRCVKVEVRENDDE